VCLSNAGSSFYGLEELMEVMNQVQVIHKEKDEK
jgi:hypothetical protein